MIGGATAAKLDSAHQALLEAVRQLRVIASAVQPRPRAPDVVANRIDLSQSQPSRVCPYPRTQIIGLWVGGDTAGRGTVNLGNDTRGVWIPGSLTVYFPLGRESAIEVGGAVQLSYTPPPGTTNWDVTIECVPAPIEG